MDRPFAEIIGAVLHELRRSGPLGLRVDELQERIESPLVASAVSTLADEGRVVVRGDLVRRSAAELTIEELRAELASAEARLAAALEPATKSEPARPHAELGKRLYALYEAVRHKGVEARDGATMDAFALGLHAASWIASYAGPIEPGAHVIRLSIGHSIIKCAVLGRHGAAGWMICSPFTGMVQIDAHGGGAPPSGGCGRVIDEDLWRLRAARTEG